MDKVVIKGKDYDMSNIHDLPEDLNAFKVTSKEDSCVVGYFGELNPLSNFFPAKFTLDGLNYISSEQFIQATKAEFFGDTDVYNQIMGCKHSVDCKDMSKKIKGVDNSKWDMVAADLCRPGILQKFVQNPILLGILVKRTGSMRIVECSKDRLWGTGVPLTHNDCLNRDNWIFPGIMGKILEDIRMEFGNQFPEQHSLNGVQSSLQNPPVPIPCQALPSHSNIGLSIPSSSSPMVELDPTSLTTNGISAPSSPINAEANDHSGSATMDYLEPMDSHNNDPTNTVQANPPGN